MNQQKADKANFLFTSAVFAPETFHAMEFEGVDEISQPYHFDLTVSSPRNDITVDAMTGTAATVYIFRENQFFPYSGIITHFKFEEKTSAYSRYSLKLMPKLWLLSLNVRSRIFQNQSVLDIIRQVLGDSGLGTYFSVNCGNYSAREFVMQYDESDFNFISRLMEESGIWYFFTEAPVPASGVNTASAERLVITDQPTSFRQIPNPSNILFREKSGLASRDTNAFKETLHALTIEKLLAPARLTVKNFNYRTPEIDISNQSQVNGGVSGTVNSFGGNSRDVGQVQQVSAIESKRISCSHTTIKGVGDCRALRAGATFDITDAPRQEFGNSLLVTQVTHKGKQEDDIDTSLMNFSYGNRFQAITSAAMGTYCPPLRTPRPKINGLYTAPIEGMGSPYAHIDDQGRYRIRIPFDTATAANAQASKPVRLAQPYSGQGYGLHFPNHENAEMIVGWIGGDPDKPIGIGTVPNANTPSPVNNNNKHLSVIRTAGGNEIVLDDTDAKQKISVKTAASNNLLLDDEHQVINLQSTAGNKLTIDDANKTISICAQQHVLTMCYDGNGSKVTLVTANGHAMTFDDQNQSIEIKSAGGHKVVMDDNSSVMTLTDDNGSNTVTLDRSAGISMETQNAITIRAQGDLTLEGANVTINSNGNLDATAAANATIHGANIDINADANATINGAAQLKATGGNATFEASAMGEVKAGGVLAVQGGVVNIN
jgi:type VI secretion system secreted protein VgrG